MIEVLVLADTEVDLYLWLWLGMVIIVHELLVVETHVDRADSLDIEVDPVNFVLLRIREAAYLSSVFELVPTSYVLIQHERGAAERPWISNVGNFFSDHLKRIFSIQGLRWSPPNDEENRFNSRLPVPSTAFSTTEEPSGHGADEVV